MKRMRRGLIVIVAAGAMALMLVACGGGDSGAPETADASAAHPEAEPAADEPTPPASEPAPARTEPAPAADMAREPAESPYGFYTVQISSWRTESTARQQAAACREQGLEAYVQRVDLGQQGIWYRVRIGRYPSLTEARRAAAALRDIPVDETWVDNFRTEGTLPPP
jgi:cell division septation protein DedD